MTQLSRDVWARPIRRFRIHRSLLFSLGLLVDPGFLLNSWFLNLQLYRLYYLITHMVPNDSFEIIIRFKTSSKLAVLQKVHQLLFHVYTCTVPLQMYLVNSFGALLQHSLFCFHGHFQQEASGGMHDSKFASVERTFLSEVRSANRCFQLATFSPGVLV